MSKETKEGMSIIVRTATRWAVSMILIFGVYILSHGHLTPGGGFAGGVIIALAFVLILLAFGKAPALSRLPKGTAFFVEDIGMIMFLAIAILGFTGGYFFLNFLGKGQPYMLFSAGIIPLCNVAISLKVGAGLFSIFIALILMRYKNEDK